MHSNSLWKLSAHSTPEALNTLAAQLNCYSCIGSVTQCRIWLQAPHSSQWGSLLKGPAFPTLHFLTAIDGQGTCSPEGPGDPNTAPCCLCTGISVWVPGSACTTQPPAFALSRYCSHFRIDIFISGNPVKVSLASPVLWHWSSWNHRGTITKSCTGIHLILASPPLKLMERSS